MNPNLGQRIPCPFPPCQADVLLVPTVPPGEPGHDNSLVLQRHKVQPDDWFGTCPASVLGYPLMPHEERMLHEQAGVFDNVKAARDREREAQRDPNVKPTRVPEHLLTPHPFPSSGFVSSTAPGPSNVIPINRPRKSGGNVTSTAEVKAALAAANEIIREAQALAAQASEKFAEARAAVEAITAQTGVELSRRQLEEGTIDCDSAAAHADVAVEVNDTYGSKL